MMMTMMYGPRRQTMRMVRVGNDEEEGQAKVSNNKDGQGRQQQ